MNIRNTLFFAAFAVLSSTASAQDLLEVYELARLNDSRIREVESEVNATREARPQSIARLLPEISASGSTSRNRLHLKRSFLSVGGVGDSFGQGTDYFWNHEAGVDLTQPVFHWDFWVKLDQSDNKVAAAEAEYAYAQQDLISRTAEAYFDLLASLDNRGFRKAEKDAIGRQLKQAEDRYHAGVIPITDVHAARAGFDQALADEIVAENSVENASEALREIINQYPDELVPLGTRLALEKPDPSDVNTWSQAAQKSNLNVIAAFNNAEFARKNIGLQRSGHYPSVDIVGSYGYFDQEGLLTQRGDAGALGVQFKLPLFEGGAVNSRTRQARYELQAAQDRLDTVRREVDRQALDAYRGVMSKISQVNALESAVASAESALTATEDGFEAGTRTMVDVLTEQRNLYRAKRNYSRARYDYIINGLSLKQAAGSLTRNEIEKVNLWLSR